ncbi:MAG: hypothetical protein JWP71_3148 [Mucilaginibacter sp.]|nr:hypothetical protein [Mucilaginibacter sp.]
MLFCLFLQNWGETPDETLFLLVTRPTLKEPIFLFFASFFLFTHPPFFAQSYPVTKGKCL